VICTLAVTIVLAHAAPLTAQAQTYPNRPVKIIVPTPPGGPVDVMARLVANQIAPLLGQSVFIDNRAGAANTLGSAEAAVRRRTAIRFSIRARAGS